MPKTAPAADREVKTTDNQPPTLEALQRAKHPKLFERFDAWLLAAKKLDGKVPKNEAEVAKFTKHVRDGLDLLNDVDSTRTAEGKPFFDPYKAINALYNGDLRDKVTPLKDAIHLAANKKLLEITRAAQAKADAEALATRQAAEAQTAKANERATAGDLRVADAIAAGAEATHQQADKMSAFATADVAEASKTVSSSSGLKASVSVDMVCTGVDKAKLDYATIAPFIKADVLVAAVNAYLKMNAGAQVTGAIMEEKISGRVSR